MKNLDVAIIGLGPAGSMLGYLLAQKGYKVLGIDYKDFPREKLCAGLITDKTVQLLERIFPGSVSYLEEKKVIVFKSTSYGVGNRQGIFWQGKLERPFRIVDRKKYDFFWYEQFQKAGGKVLRERVVKVEEGKIYLANGEILSPGFIVGADGVNSVLRRFLAQKKIVRPPHNKEQALALETFFKASDVNLPRFPSIFFGYVPSGYIWAFPHAKGFCLGIGSNKVKDGKRLKGILDEFCLSFVKNKAQKVYAHFLPYGDFEKSPAYDNCFLLGDAAGLADPLLGEGIYYAQQSAFLLASAFSLASNEENIRDIYLQLLAEEIKELRFALYWRKVVFSFLWVRDFYPLKWAFFRGARYLEETIQGKRSFCFLKPKR